MDIKKLEDEYPFLNNIVLAYKDYDEPVDKENDLYSFYDKDVTYYAGDKNKYTHISVKLLRNLRTLLGDTYKRLEKYEYCIYLYHWIYYRTKESGISNILLSTVYTEFENKKHNEIKNICPYNKYKNISKESDEIIKLNIFYDNIVAIRDILKTEHKSKDCKFQEFVHRCVHIYKKLKKMYCQTDDERDVTNKDICDTVKNFNSVYTSFILTKNEEIKIEVPSLSSTDSDDITDTIHIDGCSSNENQEEPNSFKKDQSGSSILPTVPKILGTMAGISSFMAISYKVYEYFYLHLNHNIKNTYIFFNSKINIIILSYDQIYYFIIFFISLHLSVSSYN
ncbi:hypothetical protein PVMG_04553 [Plasmodium vivax Mauritania I]|uniref:Variable surface protein n=1 Tax=Plasmodium vivax Mauritania I TaxID=1035515 RepID=A0A0J9VQS8_PLAVI|nr:hypothetical protein PVMG_04553 [Plasmodium vivax Mauritania I]